MPIYEVLPEQGKGKGRGSRILHHNLLLPCDHLPLEIQLKPAKVKRQITAHTSRDREEQNQEADNDGSDDDDDYGYYMPRDQPLPVVQPQVNTNREDADWKVTQPSQDAEPQQQDIPQLDQNRGNILTEEDTSGQEENSSRGNCTTVTCSK